jgi:hypothetical protein
VAAIGVNKIAPITVQTVLISWPEEYACVDGGDQVLPCPTTSELYLARPQRELTTEHNVVPTIVHMHLRIALHVNTIWSQSRRTIQRACLLDARKIFRRCTVVEHWPERAVTLKV